MNETVYFFPPIIIITAMMNKRGRDERNDPRALLALVRQRDPKRSRIQERVFPPRSSNALVAELISNARFPPPVLPARAPKSLVVGGKGAYDDMAAGLLGRGRELVKGRGRMQPELRRPEDAMKPPSHLPPWRQVHHSPPPRPQLPQASTLRLDVGGTGAYDAAAAGGFSDMPNQRRGGPRTRERVVPIAARYVLDQATITPEYGAGGSAQTPRWCCSLGSSSTTSSHTPATKSWPRLRSARA